MQTWLTYTRAINLTQDSIYPYTLLLAPTNLNFHDHRSRNLSSRRGRRKREEEERSPPRKSKESIRIRGAEERRIWRWRDKDWNLWECNIHRRGTTGEEVRRGASAVAENGRIIYYRITHLADTWMGKRIYIYTISRSCASPSRIVDII